MTTTATLTIKDALNASQPGQVEAALGALGNFGDMLAGVDETLTAASEAVTVSLTQPAAAIWSVTVLTNDGAADGARIIGDASVTPSATVVKVHDGNQVLEFEDEILTVRVKYLPASTNAMSTQFGSAP